MNATELARLAFRALETGDAALSRRVLTEEVGPYQRCHGRSPAHQARGSML